MSSGTLNSTRYPLMIPADLIINLWYCTCLIISGYYVLFCLTHCSVSVPCCPVVS